MNCYQLFLLINLGVHEGLLPIQSKNDNLVFFKTLVIQDDFDHVQDDHVYAKDDAHGDCDQRMMSVMRDAPHPEAAAVRMVMIMSMIMT